MHNSLLPICAQSLNLTKGDRAVLADLNLTIDHPGITIILGPNGAGKSMFLRSLHGLIEADSGDIRLGSMSVSQSRDKQAMVFQRPVLLRRSAIQNLVFAAPEIAKDQPDRIIEGLQSVNLADRADQPARMLSGGEQQRLALARSLLKSPDLLLLDEPTASLDPRSVLLIESLVKEQNHKGTKVIMVSHDLGQARRLADEIVFMSHGSVECHTLAAQFFESPATASAKAFLAGDILV